MSASYQIANRLGMHARAVAVFVQLANRYSSKIKVSKGDLVANGKSIMSMLQLAAVQGETIEIRVSGRDSREVLQALGELIGNRFGEEE